MRLPQFWQVSQKGLSSATFPIGRVTITFMWIGDSYGGGGIGSSGTSPLVPGRLDLAKGGLIRRIVGLVRPSVTSGIPGRRLGWTCGPGLEGVFYWSVEYPTLSGGNRGGDCHDHEVA